VDLTPAQRKMLLRYRAFRDRPPTLRGILAPALPRVVLALAMVTVVAIMLPAGVALFYGGIVVGAVLRHGSLAWQAVRVMPALIEMIDWDKADQLLGGTDDPIEAR